LFESALKIDPYHRYTLNTYQKLLRKLGDKESLIRAEELNIALAEIEGQLIAKPIFDMAWLKMMTFSVLNMGRDINLNNYNWL